MWSYNYYGLDSSDSLSHFGVLGMKWGRRRYQNSDGSLTAAGKSRYSLSSDQLKNIQKVNSSTKEAISASRSILKTSKDRSSKNLKDSMDLSKMTDKELQQKINRLNLERQYRDIMADEVSKGKNTVDDVLSVAGSVLTIAGSAVSVALAMKQLSGN